MQSRAADAAMGWIKNIVLTVPMTVTMDGSWNRVARNRVPIVCTDFVTEAWCRVQCSSPVVP